MVQHSPVASINSIGDINPKDESRVKKKRAAFELVSHYPFSYTMSNQSRPNRLRGILLSKVGITTDRVAERNLEALLLRVQHIRLIRQTAQTGFHYYHQRHGQEGSGYVVSFNDEKRELKELCRKLLNYARSGRSTEHYASIEIIRLCTEDAYICRLLIECIRDESSNHDTSRWRSKPLYNEVQLCLDVASQRIHTLWSGLFLPYPKVDTTLLTSEYLEANHRALMDSLRDRELSFLAARYLRRALHLRLSGNDLFNLVTIWHRYMDLAMNEPDIIEWSNLNECFESLPSDELRIAYVCPTRLANFLWALNSVWGHIPNVFRVFFGTPKISLQTKGANAQDRNFSVTYTNISMHKSHFRLLPSYRKAFLNHNDAGTHVQPPGGVIGDTVLDTESIWGEYCDFASMASERFATGLYESRQMDIARSSFDANLYHGPTLITDEHALKIFLASSLCWHFRGFNLRRNNFDIPRHVLDNVGSLIRTPKFENVPYLRRFRINGRIHITLDGPPDALNTQVENSKKSSLRDFSIDTMVLRNSCTLLWIHAGGRLSFESNRYRYCPVLAGKDEKSGTPLFVAAVKIKHIYYFTCVERDTAVAEYTDEIRERRVSKTFFVLLRLRGDENSQLRWQKFWPKKDPNYRPATDSARRDDEHLEALLNSYRDDMDLAYWD